MASDRQIVEHFHLEFLRQLCGGAGRVALCLKGGCNLRFFFDSPRYSEDLDLDVVRIPARTLRGKVDKILDSTALRLRLQSRGVALVDWSAPKQTDTTQRWKAALAVEGKALPLHTKIELSRRSSVLAGEKLEAVALGIVAEHQLMPLLVPHYGAEAAFQQKISALVGRTQVQARDVFDLAILLPRLSSLGAALGSVRAKLPAAVARALGIPFADYRSQVISYLSPAGVEQFGSKDAWEELQFQVVSALEAAP